MEISRPEKILVAMFQLANGTNQPLEYEDIVVKSWQLFPDDFGLRKYVHKYPDSSDQHKPLYGPLKDKGFVLSGNKKFRLTEKWISRTAELECVLKREIAPKGDRLCSSALACPDFGGAFWETAIKCCPSHDC